VRYRDASGPKWSRVYKSEDEARSWQVDRRRGEAPEGRALRSAGRTFNELADEWFTLATSGAIPQKGGRQYASGTLDTYQRMYDGHVRRTLGDRDANTLTGRDWQRWIDARVGGGLKRNSISVTLNVVRSVYRWACSPNRRHLVANETTGLELPARDETPRERVASPQEAQQLIAPLTSADRVAFGLAIYAGLRNVERRHVDWTDVDFKANRVNVRVSKTPSGIRTMPLVAPLRAILWNEWQRQRKPQTGLVCIGPKGGAPDYNSQLNRARRTWEAIGLEPIGFHECRHTFISTMIASGLNAKVVSVMAGHTSITITYDRYGHLFAGHEDEAHRRLDHIYEAAVSHRVSHDTEVDAASPAAVDQNR